MEVENDKFVWTILWANSLLVKFMVCAFTLCLGVTYFFYKGKNYKAGDLLVIEYDQKKYNQNFYKTQNLKKK